jgi:hypothetical protein
MNDQVRAAIIATAQSVFPLVVAFGIADLSEEQIGITMLFITNAITLIALFWKRGQEHESANPP